MKRTGNIMPLVVCPDNLRLAYWKSRLGKCTRSEVLAFSRRLDSNLLSIREQLLSGRFRFGRYHCFTIHEPKERLICAASFGERIAHHALMNVCHERFERYQTDDSYACRKGRGTFAALDRAAVFHRRYGWYLKLDVRKFFDHIDHHILKQQLLRLFKDKALLAHFDKIIDSYGVSTGCGLPIGNLTSQYFANHYLSDADHYLRECLKVKAYVRYMDDMVLWDHDPLRLQAIGYAFEIYIKEMLHLELKPFVLNRTDHGLPFLGFMLYPGSVRLNGNSKKRFIRKLATYIRLQDEGWISERDFSQGVLALYGFISHARYRVFCRAVLSWPRVGSRRPEPCRSRWQLEQQRLELSRIEPQQQQSRQPQQQLRLPRVPVAQGSETDVPFAEQAAVPSPGHLPGQTVLGHAAGLVALDKAEHPLQSALSTRKGSIGKAFV